jgi:hypothetical protein
MRLDMHSRPEIIKAHYRSYQEARKKERSEILDRLVPVTGMNRDYLATIPGRYGKDGPWEAEGAAKGEARWAALREAAGTDDTGDDRVSGGGCRVRHNGRDEARFLHF